MTANVLPPSRRSAERHAEDVDRLRVRWIDADLPEHPAVRAGLPVVQVVRHGLVLPARLPPGLAGVVGPIHVRALDEALIRGHRAAVRIPLARFRFPADLVVVDERVQRVRLRSRDVDADAAAELCGRQTLVHLGPRAAAVGRLHHAALVVAGLHARVAPLAADALPRGRVQRVRIGRVHHEVDRAGARALVEDLAPGPAAVGRLEHAAHLVVGPFVTRGRHVHDVRVGGMDDDARDGLAVGQAHVLPGPSGVRRFVDADARHRRAEDVGFAGAHPHDVRVRRRHGDVADARGRHVLPDHLPRRRRRRLFSRCRWSRRPRRCGGGRPCRRPRGRWSVR